MISNFISIITVTTVGLIFWSYITGRRLFNTKMDGFTTLGLVIAVFIVGLIVKIPFKSIENDSIEIGLSPKPVTYIIKDVISNDGTIPECNHHQITIIENAVTGQIQYKCGNLGKTNEIITFYE